MSLSNYDGNHPEIIKLKRGDSFMGQIVLFTEVMSFPSDLPIYKVVLNDGGVLKYDPILKERPYEKI